MTFIVNVVVLVFENEKDREYQRLRGLHEPRPVAACHSEDGCVRLGRRLPKQPRHSAGPRDHIFLVHKMHPLAALGGGESVGDFLGYDGGEQQEECELAREIRGRKLHSRSTLPANQ